MFQSNLRFAKLISYLFHPLFMPTLGVIYLYLSKEIPGFNLYSSEKDQWINYQFILLVIGFTFLLPLMAVIYLKKQNKINSFQMETKEERIIPFTLTGFSVFALCYLLLVYLKLPLNPLIYWFIIGSLLSIIVGLIITLFWKVSVHMIGIGGFIGMLFLLSSVSGNILFYELIISILIAGLIAYSRLCLKAHDQSQIVIGFLIGFSCESFYLIFI